MTSIDNLHGGLEALIARFNTDYPARNFAPGFNAAVGENYPRPHHKATSSGTWELLAAQLQAGLRKAHNETALERTEK